MRAGHRARLTPEGLEFTLIQSFGAAERQGDHALARFGAIEEIRVRGERTKLLVELKMNPKVDETIAAETVHRYNRFLESATGYTAKERARRLRKPATSGA